MGEELNPNIDQGLLELVKNAYDADATECHIWLDANGDGHTVAVEDNGVGMDADDIVSGWLVLGSSSKRSDRKTQLGRTPAGNKGLGRLAALRLGRKARMVSRPKSGGEFSVELDWDAFDAAKTVDDVQVGVAFTPDTDRSSGTRIELSALRGSIGRVDVRRLARSLVLLADPFSDEPSSFKPHLHSDEFADLALQVAERYFDQADYHLIASLRSGRASVQVVDWKGEVLWEGAHEDVATSRDKTLYATPDADVDVWAFLLSGENFASRPVQLGAVREWLRAFGGVHVYMNGLRVAPYGNPGNDWLDMNLARVRDPEDRPGTNTSIGRVRVSDSGNVLVQKTDRSGFIESEAYEELRRFTNDALEWMARRRRAESERKRQNNRQQAKSNANQGSKTVLAQIEKIPDQGTKEQLQRVFESYERARDLETDVLRREVQLYRTLSTAGITAATFAHESQGNPLKTISIINNTLKSTLAKDLPGDYALKYQRQLERVSESVESLGVLSSATLQLIRQDKRRLGKVRLNGVIREVADIFKPFLEGRQVALELELVAPGEPFIRGAEAALESVVTNLINNSLAAFERAEIDQRRLLIKSRVVDRVWELTVADNGPGIEGISLADIWLPGQTQRQDGTGLGLTIVRDTVADLGGKVEAVAHGVLGGASFVVRLTILGVDDV
jgi:signal transduction histidine kinase